jgi:hypothetical protein
MIIGASAGVGQLVGDLAPASSSSNGPIFAYGLIGLISFGIWLWALIALLSKPRFAFESAGVNRLLWLVLLIGSLFCGLAGLVGLVYLLLVNSRVRNQQSLGRGPGFPGQ